LAEQMEVSSHLLVSRVSGRDQAVRGPLRVTMAPTLATHLLMPDFAAFSQQHPEIEMEIHSTLENLNLTNREADVALRVVFDRNSLPQNLHGVKGPDLSVGVYMSRDLLAAWKAGNSGPIRWISKNKEGVPEWANGDVVEITGAPFRVPEDAAHLEAMRLGLGISALPSFVGDSEPLLVRVPGTPLGPHGTLWVLAHGETRKTKRVRMFTEFISERLRAHASVLGGDKSRQDRLAN
jgi:DNA-binding transcriptional LysR family regulator